MESSMEQALSQQEEADSAPTCGRPGCACSLRIAQRFVLWAVRQWQQDGTLPVEGSALHRGFKVAGLLTVLPDFAVAMDAVQFGSRRALSIHAPACARVSDDEATLLALCELAQTGCERPFVSSLDLLMAPAASRVTATRLRSFVVALAEAGLHLSPPPVRAGARLH